MNTSYDVVIAGGGLSGGCLALALVDAGINVAIVEPVTDEKRHDSPAGNRALALSYGTACLMHDLGLWEGVRRQATPIRNIHVSDRGGFGKVRLSAKKENVDALGYVIAARILEDKIAASLRESPVELICPARLKNVELQSASVLLELESESGAVSVNARLLVGSDGGNSAVRRLTNLRCESHDYNQVAIVTTVRPEVDPRGTAFERFTEDGPLALLPTDDAHCSVVWTRGLHEAVSLRTLNDEEFLSRLQECFGFYLGHLAIVGKRVELPLKLIRAREIVAPRTVLVGNAVHQLHPVAGQGFNLGMRDLAVLAEKIVSQCNEGGDPGSGEMLRSYESIRKMDHNRVVGITDGLIRIFSNDWWPFSSARNVGLLSLEFCPAGKRYFARSAMGVDGRKPRMGAGF